MCNTYDDDDESYFEGKNYFGKKMNVFFSHGSFCMVYVVYPILLPSSGGGFCLCLVLLLLFLFTFLFASAAKLGCHVFFDDDDRRQKTKNADKAR